MYAVRRGIVVAAADSGTQSIVVSSFAAMGDVPKGARIWATSAQADATDTDQAQWSDYLVDQAGTVVGCSVQSEHGQGTTDTSRRAADDGTVVAIIDGSGVVAKQGAFAGFVAGGLEITWSGSVALPVLLHVELIFGDRVRTFAGQVNGTPGDIDCGFVPDHIETVSHVSFFNETINRPYQRQVAHFVRVPGTLTVEADHFAQEARNNQTTSQLTVLSSDSPAPAQAFTGGSFITINNISLITGLTHDGFSVDTTPSGTGPRFAFLAINYGGRNRVAMQRIEAPASDGLQQYQFGFEPWTLKAILQAVTSNTDFSDLAGAGGLGYADREEQFCAYTTDDDDQATTDTQSRSEGSKFARMATGDGTTMAYEAMVESWDACGVTLDWSLVSGAAHRASLIALERDHVSACGHVTSPFPSAEGQALAGTLAEGEVTAPFPSAEGQAQQTFLAEGEVTAPFPSAEGQAQAETPAQGEVTAPFPSAMGFAQQTFDAFGLVKAPFPSAEGTAEETFFAQGAAVAPFPAASGVAEQAFVGAGEAVAPFPSAEGTAQETFSAQGEATAPFPSAEGTAQETFPAQGEATAPFPSAEGTAETDSPPPPEEDCSEVELDAQYDGEASLSAQYDGEANLVANLDGETELSATYEGEVVLDAELDGEVSVTAEC